MKRLLLAPLFALFACNDYSTEESDAGVATPTGAAFCTQQSPAPTFCSDFNDGKLPGPWQELLQKGSATGSADQGGFLTHYGSGSASLHQTGIRVPTKSFVFAADVRVDDFAKDGELDALVLRLPTAGDEHRELQFTLKAAGKTAFVPYVDGGYRNVQDLPNITVGKVVRVAINVEVATKRAFVTMDGAPVGGSATITVAPDRAPEIFVGDANAGTTTSWTVRFDNVTVQVD